MPRWGEPQSLDRPATQAAKNTPPTPAKAPMYMSHRAGQRPNFTGRLACTVFACWPEVSDPMEKISDPPMG